MRIENSYRIIPCYTADVSGVCSALYELGGMVVMHDPSGCNSTYNTHDETRWYNNDSLIYISGLTELDAIMGNDKKLVDDICDAAERLSPKFIALCGSPIPFINGTDYKALATIIEKKTGISAFSVETNGTHDYVQGAGLALLRYAEHVLKPVWDRHSHDKSTLTHPSVNVLGATPLDFTEKSTLYSLRNALAERDINIISVFSMLGVENVDYCYDIFRSGSENPENWRKIYSSWNENNLHSLENAVFADVNLVVSAVGCRLAEFMYESYGLPYVTGLPIGSFADRISEDIRRAASDRLERHSGSSVFLPSYADRNSCLINSSAADSPEIAIIGEPVTSGSIAAAITKKYGKAVSVLCPLEKCERLLSEGDYGFKGELQCTELMKCFKHVIADPLYLPICPDSVSLHRLPHEAFSGRCFWSEMKNLVTLLD